jgi:pimeloyl-ACP methyl ester carboxylesterase
MAFLTSRLAVLALFSSIVSAYVYTDPNNDFSCRSSSHPNPVVTLHGLGATYYEDINYLGDWLRTQGFCVFRLTYGAYEGFPFIGGLTPVSDSAAEIASFVRQVQSQTGATKVDLVGHSEGGFQSLFVPKFQGVAPIVERIVAIAPPTHGTTFDNLETLAIALDASAAVNDVLKTLGCFACTDLTIGASAVQALDQGPIVQPGNRVTIITSRTDELVTPPSISFITNEPNVTNQYVQDACPLDPVGHIGEGYDLNVWNMVLNALEDAHGRLFPCSFGSPGK